MITDKEDKILSAALTVFLRYGYKRVTINDIAVTAGMSRPSVYLVFPGKEEILQALMNQTALRNLEEIRQGIEKLSSPKEKLMHTFEIWTVKPFELVLTSPNAKELMDSMHELARKVYEHTGLLFEAELTKILKPAMKSTTAKIPSPERLAHMLRHSVRGLKNGVNTPDELRQSIEELVNVILAATPKAQSKAKKA